METLEQLQNRIASYKDLRSIVRTMKALSAVSIRQYEQAVRSLSDYYRTIELGLHVVIRTMGKPVPPQRRKRQKILTAAIVFGSDHGLCGRFNEDIASHALERLRAISADPQQRRVLAVGSRVAAHLEHGGQSTEEDFLTPGSAARITATVQQILMKIDEWQAEGHALSVYLFYNRHLSGSNYRSTGTQLLPIDLDSLYRLEKEKQEWPFRTLPTFTIDRQRLFSSLLRQYIFVSIFRACAESLASEHASRLAAMQAAEKNLEERFDEVTGQYRRLRQDVITGELLDVVAGFETLTGGAS